MRKTTSCLSIASLLVASLQLGAGACAPALAARASTLAWGGDADLEAFHTTDLFPGGPTRDSDNGIRLDLRPELTVRLGHGLRVRPWASWTGERYETWSARDLDRWEFGLDVRRGPFRVRGFGGFTHDELYFPTPTGGVFLDRSHWGVEGRYEPAPGWLTQVVFTRDRENFIPTYDERDDHRWTVRSVVERRFSPRARLAVSHAYRRTESVTDLYSYEQNALRLEGDVRPGAGFIARGLGEFGLREYRTGRAFALNFGREDDRWRAEVALGHPVIGPLSAEARGSWRQRMSTRDSKNYTVRTIGLALTASR